MDEPTASTAQATATEPATGFDKSAAAKLVLATILGAAFVAFAIQNTDSTQVDFLTWTFDTPRIVLILISAVAAITIWELASLVRRRRKRNA